MNRVIDECLSTGWGQSKKTRIGSPMDDTACAVALVGKEGLEPSRLAAHDPKSCSSASSDTSPTDTCYTTDYTLFAPAVHTSARGFRSIDRHGRHARIANPLPAILPIHIASPPHTHVIPAQTHVILTPTTPSTRATSVTPTPTTPSTHPSRHSRVGGNLALHLRRASRANTPNPHEGAV